jgi:excisionase family DNA binding protein
MLTAKDVQEMLKVDRSTVYRMAENGRLPAFKVGKQWRFQASDVNAWLANQVNVLTPANLSSLQTVSTDLASQLPVDCVQLIQDTFADMLGVMVVVADMNGRPVTQISHTCGLLASVMHQSLPLCIEQWKEMAQSVALEPQFVRSHLGLLCARGLIRVGTEIKGMVVVGGITPPDQWPPSEVERAKLANTLNVTPELLHDHLDEVYVLDEAQRQQCLIMAQKMANIISHILQERHALLGRLEAIADLSRI